MGPGKRTRCRDESLCLRDEPSIAESLFPALPRRWKRGAAWPRAAAIESLLPWLPGSGVDARRCNWEVRRKTSGSGPSFPGPRTEEVPWAGVSAPSHLPPSTVPFPGVVSGPRGPDHRRPFRPAHSGPPGPSALRRPGSASPSADQPGGQLSFCEAQVPHL